MTHQIFLPRISAAAAAAEAEERFREFLESVNLAPTDPRLRPRPRTEANLGALKEHWDRVKGAAIAVLHQATEAEMVGDDSAAFSFSSSFLLLFLEAYFQRVDIHGNFFHNLWATKAFARGAYLFGRALLEHQTQKRRQPPRILSRISSRPFSIIPLNYFLKFLRISYKFLKLPRVAKHPQMSFLKSRIPAIGISHFGIGRNPVPYPSIHLTNYSIVIYIYPDYVLTIIYIEHYYYYIFTNRLQNNIYCILKCNI